MHCVVDYHNLLKIRISFNFPDASRGNDFDAGIRTANLWFFERPLGQQFSTTHLMMTQSLNQTAIPELIMKFNENSTNRLFIPERLQELFDEVKPATVTIKFICQ